MTRNRKKRHENEPAVAAETERRPASARSLVDQMVAAGEWPEPELLEQIVAAGEAAVEPLLESSRRRPRGWPAGGSDLPCGGAPEHAPAGLRPARPLCGRPVLQERDHRSLGHALAAYGPPGLDALIELIRDPTVSGIPARAPHRRRLTRRRALTRSSEPGSPRPSAGSSLGSPKSSRRRKRSRTNSWPQPPPEDAPIERAGRRGVRAGRRREHDRLRRTWNDLSTPATIEELDDEAIRHMDDSSNEIAPDRRRSSISPWISPSWRTPRAAT